MRLDRYPKVYFGPMSKNIVDTLLDMSNKYPIGFIPSRRQVEHDGGYVNNWTSEAFFKYVKSRSKSSLVCRDHGGRLQGQEIDDGDESIGKDSLIGYDIIHVDPWKKFSTITEIAQETSRVIKLCLSINKNVKFEIGTEEAIKHYSHEQLDQFLGLVKQELKEQFESVIYAVVQFGTKIIGTKNVGFFDKNRAKKMIKVVKKYDLMSKEHNGDYLSEKELKDRFSLGLDAINIAPEFGTFETTALIEYFINNLEMEKLDDFFDICYMSNKWKKWIPEINKFQNFERSKFYDYLICKVSGHYIFSTEQVAKWKTEDLKIDVFLKNKLKKEIVITLQAVY